MRHSPTSRRGAFTLIEIMVVLALAAIVTAITVGGFRSISESNKRTSCQSNLVQIYQACRVYARDEGGAFPYYNPASGGISGPSTGGIGLWALYTYPANGSATDLAPVDTKPVGRYVRSPKVFHCPSDDYQRGSIGASSAQLYNANKTLINPDYLSYQVDDEGTPTYSVFRTTDVSTVAKKELWKRQLEHYDTQPRPRPTPDTTVVAWCRFHRRLSSDGLSTLANGRNFDNVLFYDGTVQLLPWKQDVSDTGGSTNQCTTWQRVPREKADTMKFPTECVPN